MKYRHTPVMLDEVVQYLEPAPGKKYIDCTFGGGGYSRRLAELVDSGGIVIGLDADRLAVDNFKKDKFTPVRRGSIRLYHGNFKNLQDIIQNKEPRLASAGFDGVVFDLGLSSAQLEDRSRGFSYQLDAPLDMAFGEGAVISTTKIINKYKQDELKKIIWRYGEEKFAGRISRKIVEERAKEPIETTTRLKEIIVKAIPGGASGRQKIHPATRTFQALRIATNDELSSLESALEQALRALKSGGRLVVVSYHSLEDRITKHFFKDRARGCVCPPETPICGCGHESEIEIITRKPILPSESEIKKNPRARSAKLRAVEKK